RSADATGLFHCPGVRRPPACTAAVDLGVLRVRPGGDRRADFRGLRHPVMDFPCGKRRPFGLARLGADAGHPRRISLSGRARDTRSCRTFRGTRVLGRLRIDSGVLETHSIATTADATAILAHFDWTARPGVIARPDRGPSSTLGW